MTAAPIQPETPADAAEIEALVLAAFGPGRFAKTAERLRERAAVAAGFVAREDGRVVGSVRLWRIAIGEQPALFLGPIAVDASRRRDGLGAALVARCLETARCEGQGVLLVGDAPYFSRFGFRRAERVTLPGPVDPARLLWRGEDGIAGRVEPA
jgi:predicted N-acetyltransferase YhbS